MDEMLKQGAKRGETGLDEGSLQQLREQFEWAVLKRDSSVYARGLLNHRTRYCVWRNQSADGKKWRADKGKKIFPWAGASDSRVALVDKYIRQDTAFLMTVWRRMRTVVSGTEATDAAWGSRMTQFLRWMKYTQMKEVTRELRYGANLFLERGSVVMGVFWEEEQALGYEEIDLEQLVVQAQQARAILEKSYAESTETQRAQSLAQIEMVANLPEMIMDPSQEEGCVAVAAGLYPEVNRKQLRRAVRDLREQGHARLARPYVKKARPAVVALALNEDIFFPPETTNGVHCEHAAGAYRRELLTEAQLRGRVTSHGWDEEWVNEVVRTQRGIMSVEVLSGRAGGGVGAQGRANISWASNGGATSTDDTRQLFEVVHAYRKLADEDGITGIYCTVFSPGLLRGTSEFKGGYAYHDLLNYDHGEYPFLLIEREVLSRRVDDARGYGEVASTWQNQVKTEWDSRVDRASIATLPPMMHPPGEAPSEWGPGVEVPTARPDAYKFADAPKWDPGSKEVELSVTAFADEYFGRQTSEFNGTISTVMRQDLADIWMEGCAAVDNQVLQLCQQFMPDEFYYRVVGSAKGKPLRLTRDEIQGQFDLTVGYNIENLDLALKKEKMDLIEKLLMMDVNGIVDRTAAMEVVCDLVDPSIGELLLKPAENATQAEIEDEQNVFARMYAGIPVDVKPQGQAYGLRLQVLQGIMQGNPEAQSKYAKDEHFREVVGKRMKQLQFQVQQRQNAVIGRLGA